MDKIGVVGLGRMGTAVAARLSGVGFAVSGWTRSGVSADQADRLGIVGSEGLGSLVSSSDIMLLCLSDDAAVFDVVDRIGRLEIQGKLLVDTSTVGPTTLKEAVERIRSSGVAALDAPLSGWPSSVSNGSAGLYIGGDAVQVARFMPVASALSNRVHHVGGLGQGAAMKIVNNMMLTGYWQCLKEALQLGKRAGLQSATMLRILAGSPAANGSLAGKTPVILGESDDVTFSVDGIVEDLSLFTRVAAHLDVDTPSICSALASFEMHRKTAGGEMDFATMLTAALDTVRNSGEAADVL